MSRPDPHSFHDPTQPQIAQVDWRARVDFASKTLDAEVTLGLAEAGEGPIDLDTRELTITRVTDGNGAPLGYDLAAAAPILGQRLRIELPAGTREICIAYRTSPTASALQWLAAAQTASGREPFLYSQCQQIHARTILPLQDTPAVRVRLRVALTVPARLQVLCAAAFVARDELDGEACVRYALELPIPPYLIAFAVGELESRELGPRSRVWADPALAERAAHELAGVDEMVRAAERLFGPYEWGRFNLLVMPQAFPYGGMENPCLAFLTPTLLAGDRSGAPIVAHELAHAWTGNLVSNASAEHFWLNEGWTVLAERRLVAELFGEAAAALQAVRGHKELLRALDDYAEQPALTRLALTLDGVPPEEGLSIVAYEKGYLLLRALEEAAGRSRFDSFVRDYLSHHRFQSITSAQFLAFVERALPEASAQVDVRRWIDEPGLPERAPPPPMVTIDPFDAARTHALSPVEWTLYLDALARPADATLCEALATRFALTTHANTDVRVAWLALAIESDRAEILPAVDALLGETGRMTHLKTLYLALARRPSTRELAGALFRRYRARYHPIAQKLVDTLLRQRGIATQDVNAIPLRRR